MKKGREVRIISSVLIVACLIFIPLFSCSKDPVLVAKKHVQKGDDYFIQEKYREAVIEYKNAAAALPENSDLRWKLA